MRPVFAACLEFAHRGVQATMTDAQADDEDIDKQGVDELFGEVYHRLKAMAGRQLARPQSGATLDTTALVHDVYLRMNTHELTFARRAQFFAYAARAMRHLITDHARQRMSMRAGGDWMRVTLSAEDEELVIDSASHAIALDDALGKLEKIDARATKVVELRYFGGLTIEQVAETLDIGPRTVDRDWRFACAFLRSEIG
jgi:RNA polymerase sigma factor (TIGR02999 family)